MKVSSKTGAVHVRFIKSAFNHAIRENGEEKGASERTYRTHIETLTGQISAELFHGGAGGETVLEAATGMLDLRITPIGDMESRIQTSTRTGLSKVTVDAPMQGTSLKNLTAVHKSRATGMLDIRYPGEWEGRVHAWSQGTGVVDVKGDGLNFQTVGKDVYAWRGDNASKGGRILDVVSEGTGLVRFRA